MERLKMQTPDLVDENIEKIGKLFPECITECIGSDGKPEFAVDFDKLRLNLSKTPLVEGSDERYQFTWPDKQKMTRLASVPINKTLRPCREKSVDFDNTENLYIEGDNLDVLKLLREDYLGKIKMIYIDPPYNTGKDFVYKDDFSLSDEEYKAISGQLDDVGARLISNVESGGRFHTNWLNMIYPRLRVARDFLSLDGVIFISSDDHEVGNLRKIADEIFGGNNFLANLVWEKKYTVANDAKFFSDNHDHILCYAKSAENFIIGRLPRTEDMDSAYKNPDNHPKGPWKATPLHAKSGSSDAAAFSYTFKNGVVFTPPPGTFSRYSAETLKRFDDNNEIWFGTKGNSVPSRKTFLCDLKNSGVVPRTIIPFTVGGHNHEAVDELKQLLGDSVFNDPKPTRLIDYFLTVANLKDDSIVLDFFSGSGTTAHSLMKYNYREKKHCKFILVQINESTPENSVARKNGYDTICEIGERRVLRAGEEIINDWRASHSDNSDNTQDIKIDVGFRVLKVDSSNMKDVYYNPSDVTNDLFAKTEDNIKEDRTDEDLLFQVMLELSVPLSATIRSEEICDRKVLVVDDNYLIACFDKNITDAVIAEIAKRKPQYFVMRDSSAMDDSVITNFETLFQTYSKDTVRKIL